MKIVPDDILLLKKNGYIALGLKPLSWKVRGETGAIEVYPFAKKYQTYHGGPVYDYTDVLEAVRSQIQPYEMMTPDQLDAFNLWKDGLRQITELIHMRRFGKLAGDGIG